MGSDSSLQRFTAAVVGLLVGQLVASNSATLARVWWYLYDESRYTSDRVAELSLYVIYVVASAGACLGAWAVKRGWATLEQVVTSLAVAALSVGLSIVDHSMPPPKQGDTLPFGETSYYLGWLLGLWFLPFVLLVGRNGEAAGWLNRAGGLLCTSVFMGMVGMVVGLSVEAIVSVLGESYIKDAQQFWVARPATINTIGGSYVVVAFASIWWRRLWATAGVARTWTVCAVVGASAYAGLYGWLYCENGLPAGIWCALSFSMLPTVTGAGVLGSYLVSRRSNEDVAVGWPVTRRFWWLLPVSLTIGFASVALFGFGPLVECCGVQDAPNWVLVSAHALNGGSFGAALGATTYVFRLIRSIVGRDG